MLFTVRQKHPFIKVDSRLVRWCWAHIKPCVYHQAVHLFPNPNVVFYWFIDPKERPPVLTFPLWDQRGGSSWPWGSRPFSRQDRNWSKWPPLGKRSGGLWIPSWLTSTTVPPLSTAGDIWEAISLFNYSWGCFVQELCLVVDTDNKQKRQDEHTNTELWYQS